MIILIPLIIIILEHCGKSLLRHFNGSELTHPLFAFFLLFEKLFLSRDISAVALGNNVFPVCTDSFPGNDLLSDTGLYRHFELMHRYNFFKFLADETPSGISFRLMTEYKVKRIIRIGTAGSFHKDIRIGDIVLGISASTDSNYQHSFRLPGNYAPCASWDLLKKTLEINKEMKLSINAGNIVSCDVFYEADPEWWKKWAAMGVMAVEMEAAALYMWKPCELVTVSCLDTILNLLFLRGLLRTRPRIYALSFSCSIYDYITPA